MEIFIIVEYVLSFIIYILIGTRWCLGKPSMTVLFKAGDLKILAITLLKQPCKEIVFMITL